MGMYIKSNSSRTIHNVLIARFRTLVYATSNSYPPSLSSLPPWLASDNPLSLRPASAQPVKMLRSFHVDSPCRTSTSLCEPSPVVEEYDGDDDDDDDDDDDEEEEGNDLG